MLMQILLKQQCAFVFYLLILLFLCMNLKRSLNWYENAQVPVHGSTCVQVAFTTEGYFAQKKR